MRGIDRPSRRQTCVLSTAMALSVSLLPCFAEDEPDLTLSLEELLEVEVTTASKFAQKRTDAPAAVTVITAEDIRDYGYRTLADLLRAIPGLYVSYDRNYSYVGAHGFSRPGDYNTRLLLLVDGYRMNDNVYDGAYIGSEFILDADLIDRVEFVSGPGSSIYGGNALFGVINVITKSGHNMPYTEIAVGAGSADERRGRISYGSGGVSSGIDVLVAGSGWATEGIDLYFPEFDDPATNGGVANGRDSDKGEQFFAKVTHGSVVFSTAFSRRTKQVPTASYFQVFNQEESETTDEQFFMHIADNRELRPGINLFGTVYYGQYDYEGLYAYDTGVNLDLSRGRWWGGEMRVLFTPVDSHKVLVGGEYRQDPHRDQKNFTADPYFLYLDDQRSKTTYAGYIQDEWRVSENTRFNLGVRHDRSDEEARATSPRLALVQRFSRATVGKFLYGTAFRSPNAYEQYYVTDAGNYKTNPDLRHEKIRTTELVLEHSTSDRVRLTGSLFVYQIDNLITLTTDSTDGLLVFENLDEAKARGVELIWWRSWSAGANLRASASWQRAEDPQTGVRLLNSPSRLAKLNMDVPLFSGWRGGWEMQYVDARITPFDNVVGGYTVANLTVHRERIWRGVDIGLSIYNLLDESYADSPSDEHADNLGRRLGEIRQNDRTFLGRVKFRF